MTKRFMSLALALSGLALTTCGKSSSGPTTQPPDPLPTPPVVVCNPQFPPTLIPGWTLQTGRAVGETVLTQKSSIKVTFEWSPSTAPTGSFVMPNLGLYLPTGPTL
jgi:hypothetical protein